MYRSTIPAALLSSTRACSFSNLALPNSSPSSVTSACDAASCACAVSRSASTAAICARNVAACASSLVSATVAFAVTKTYQPLVDSIGRSWVFWIYAGSSVTAVPHVMIFMPETRGKSLLQIRDELVKI